MQSKFEFHLGNICAKKIHCLSEVQIHLNISYFFWQLQCLSQLTSFNIIVRFTPVVRVIGNSLFLHD